MYASYSKVRTVFPVSTDLISAFHEPSGEPVLGTEVTLKRTSGRFLPPNTLFTAFTATSGFTVSIINTGELIFEGT